MDAIDLDAAFEGIREYWSPHLAGDVNDASVKLVKLRGEFVWHHHEHEDELFLVHRGQFTMRFRDGDVVVKQGSFLIVPHGVEHCPVADEPCEVLLFEPNTTRNTGNLINERTRVVQRPAIKEESSR